MAALSPPPTLSPDDSKRYLDDDVLLEESTPPAKPLLWTALALGAVFAIAFWLGAYTTRHTTQPPAVGPFEGQSGSTSAPLVVYVTGAVNRPGVYKFPVEARVQDAVRKAGGPKKNADLDAVNLAAWLEDGGKVEVPVKQPVVAALPALSASTSSLPDSQSLNEPEEEPQPQSASNTAALSPSQASAVASTPAPRLSRTEKRAAKEEKKPTKVLPQVPREVTPTGAESQNASPEYLQKHPLNLNTATAEQLELLPGIGPATAQKILDYRAQKGAFKSVDELDNVAGIGAKTLEKLRPLVTVQ